MKSVALSETPSGWVYIDSKFQPKSLAEKLNGIMVLVLIICVLLGCQTQPSPWYKGPHA